jgi:hypothetical protein
VKPSEGLGGEWGEVNNHRIRMSGEVDYNLRFDFESEVKGGIIISFRKWIDCLRQLDSRSDYLHYDDV